MAAPKKSITCSKTLQDPFLFEFSTLKIGWRALQLTTQAPNTLSWAKKWLFLANFGPKMRFFGDGGSEKLDYLLQNLTNHFLF